MRTLLLDGHPRAGALASHLLDIYEAELPGVTDRVALADLDFDETAMRSYAETPPWEPDLADLWQRFLAADHLVLAFPLWWGDTPARLSGLFERLFLPHRAFAYHRDDPWWERGLAGRSADLLITTDTPPLWLRLAWRAPIVHRLRHQVLGFVGFRPVRAFLFGPVRRGGAERNLPRWEARAARAARQAPGLGRGAKHAALQDP